MFVREIETDYLLHPTEKWPSSGCSTLRKALPRTYARAHPPAASAWQAGQQPPFPSGIQTPHRSYCHSVVICDSHRYVPASVRERKASINAAADVAMTSFCLWFVQSNVYCLLRLLDAIVPPTCKDNVIVSDPVSSSVVAVKPPFYPSDLPSDKPRGQIITNPATGVQHEVLPFTSTCNGWRTRAECYCSQPAGWHTTHEGTGRCFFHDTSKAVETRMRLYYIRQTTIGALALELDESDTNPTDITSELHLARATLLNWIARYDDWQAKVDLWAQAYARGDVVNQPPARMDISRIDALLQRVASLALQLEESKLRDAISQGELIEILREVGMTVETTVTVCPHCKGTLAPVLELIRQGWQRVQLWNRRARRKA